MHHLKLRHALHGVLLACALSSLPAQGARPTANAPFHVLLNQTRYEVKPDLSYTEYDEMRIEVLNAAGAGYAGHFPVGLTRLQVGPMIRDREIIVDEAYTRKQNGTKVPAEPTTPPPGAPEGVARGAKWMAFQQVEVGDQLYIKGRILQKSAVPQNSLVLDEVVEEGIVVDEQITELIAPASLKLHVNAQGVTQVHPAPKGGKQRWVWRYRADSEEAKHWKAHVHISTLASDKAERAAFIAYMRKTPLPQMTEQNRCELVPGMPNDGPQGKQFFASVLARQFGNDPRLLERLIDGWNTPSCVMADGRPRLQAFSGAFYQVFARDWEGSLLRIKELKKQYPHHAFVALLEAEYWLSYAWYARGTGYSNTVTEEGWKLFKERLAKAYRVLYDSREYASTNPVWFEQLLDVMSLQERPYKERVKIFRFGIDRFKTYYPLYFSMLNHSLPKWGGSWKLVESYANWSVKVSDKADGQTMYARLYWAVGQGLSADKDLFEGTYASWPKMRKGFEDMMARYPSSNWNLNNFAHFACLAGDKATYRKLHKQIGRNIMRKAWNSQSEIDLCNAKYGG